MDERPVSTSMASEATINQQSQMYPYAIVGIGASAGGLSALTDFFRYAPTDTDLSFVVVQHLSAIPKSNLPELLERITSLPASIIVDGERPQPNTIHLMPAQRILTLQEGVFRLAPPDPAVIVPLPIDLFFVSLADQLGTRAMGVILSGTGNDGSRGVIDLHAAGGLVVVQDPSTAEFDGMPRSACETGLVDLVLPPDRIPSVLSAHAQYPERGRGVPTSGGSTSAEDTPLSQLFRLLWTQYGVDFSQYKRNTMMRRVERRLSWAPEDDLAAYIRRLHDDPVERHHVYQDLLIGVTGFFRDPEAFAYFGRDVLPQLVEAERNSRQLRIWVAGCGTGEEAYSLAMLCHEYVTKHAPDFTVQIFASDIYQHAIDIASMGEYRSDAVAAVAPERRSRYFIEDGDIYRVSMELRRIIVFTRHDLTQDAPFTNLNLVSCRNLLIYFEPPQQQQVLKRLHYGLKIDGVLMLGLSETVGDMASGFAELHRHWKLYRKTAPSGLLMNIQAPRLRQPPTEPARSISPSQSQVQVQELMARQRLYNSLLDTVMPAGILVNTNGAVEHIVGDVSAFLPTLHGPLSVHLLDLVHPSLQNTVRVAMLRATHDRRRVTYRGISMTPEAPPITVRATPLNGPESELPPLFVTFETEVVQPPSAATDAMGPDHDEEGDATQRIAFLEQELQRTQASLYQTVEDLHAANEELQSINEEQVTANEELQSSNEELQSVNEELYTVNAEYQLRNQQLADLNTEMSNLLRSTAIGTVFLDYSGRIRKYTPALTAVIPLQPQDIGRPLNHFTTLLTLERESLDPLLTQVLQHRTPLTREVLTTTGTSYLMRIHPFVNSMDTVEGTVVTFIDITERIAAEQERQVYEAQFRDLVEGSIQGIIIHRNFRPLFVNAAFAAIHGYETPEPILAMEHYADALIAPSELPRLREYARRRLQSEAAPTVYDFQGRRQDGETVWLRNMVSMVQWEGLPAIQSTVVDITDQKRAEDALHTSDERYRDLYNQTPVMLHSIDRNGRLLSVSDYWLSTLGYTREEVIGRDATDFLTEASRRHAIEEGLPAFFETGLSVDVPYQMVKENGEVIDVLLSATAERDIEGQVTRSLAVILDVTTRKQAEEALHRLAVMGELAGGAAHELRHSMASIGTAASFLQMALETPQPNIRKMLEIMAQEVTASERIVSDFLNFARPSTLRRHHVDLNDVLRAVLEQARVPETVDVTYQPDPTLPSMRAEADKLSQICRNLIVNAIQAMPDGGKLVVKTGQHAAHRTKTVTVSVEDNGVGIGQADLERIFDPLFTTKSRGLGLGLRVVKNLVEQHGGTITVQSQLGQGSRFIATFPTHAEA